MSRGQTLRALVNERLAATAEDIFVLFERTIAEYEEELCRSKEENQRKQQLLDKVVSPKTDLVRGNFQIPWMSPGNGLNPEITETLRIKEEPEEQIVKQEEEQLPVPVPESSAVCVKTEESSLLQQRQNAHREETQGEDISSEHFLLETEGHAEHSSDTDNDDNWEPFSCSAAQIETEVDGDQYNQVKSSENSTNLCLQNKSAPETTVHSEHVSGAHRGGAERKKHQCPFCNKIFMFKGHLENHLRVHTGEKPYSCLVCMKTFTQKCHLDAHKRTHTGEKPYSCSSCEKHFADHSSFNRHKRTHTGEKPYSCSICEKTFALKSVLDTHKRTHTGEKPYSCSNCGKTFTQKSHLDAHERTHTGEKPYSCAICGKHFADPSSFRRHKSTHRRETLQLFNP